jgi:hypothetical protein
MLMPKQCSQSPSLWLTYQACNRSRFVIGFSQAYLLQVPAFADVH